MPTYMVLFKIRDLTPPRFPAVSGAARSRIG
jgi:hypothetical protein